MASAFQSFGEGFAKGYKSKSGSDDDLPKLRDDGGTGRADATKANASKIDTESPGGKDGWWTPERKAYAVDKLVEKGGLSEWGAAGLVARWANVESARGGPKDINSIGATGIAQWLGPRKQELLKSGKLDFDSQLDFAIRELGSTESRAGKVLRSASSPFEAARGASMFERAEGYNSRTGTDDFTARTPVKSVYAGVFGGREAGAPHASGSLSYAPAAPARGDAISAINNSFDSGTRRPARSIMQPTPAPVASDPPPSSVLARHPMRVDGIMPANATPAKPGTPPTGTPAPSVLGAPRIVPVDPSAQGVGAPRIVPVYERAPAMTPKEKSIAYAGYERDAAAKREEFAKRVNDGGSVAAGAATATATRPRGATAIMQSVFANGAQQ